MGRAAERVVEGRVAEERVAAGWGVEVMAAAVTVEEAVGKAVMAAAGRWLQKATARQGRRVGQQNCRAVNLAYAPARHLTQSHTAAMLRANPSHPRALAQSWQPLLETRGTLPPPNATHLPPTQSAATRWAASSCPQAPALALCVATSPCNTWHPPPPHATHLAPTQTAATRLADRGTARPQLRCRRRPRQAAGRGWAPAHLGPDSPACIGTGWRLLSWASSRAQGSAAGCRPHQGRRARS